MKAQGMDKIADIIEAACCFGRYSDSETWREGVDKAIEGYVKLILASKEFHEEASRTKQKRQ